MTHYDDGSLRALIDGEADTDTDAMNTHLAACQQCQLRLEVLQEQAKTLAQLLRRPATAPDPAQTLERFRSTIVETPNSSIYRPLAEAPRHTAAAQERVAPMKTSKVRRWLAPLGALIVAIALLALPPVRAAADQLLQIFRVQTVLFVPVSQDRMQQLEKLNIDDKSLFVAEPQVRHSAESRTVTSAAEASSAAGFDIAEPAGQTGSSYKVSGKSEVAFQVDVNSAREILQLTGVDDVTLPDALGSQPIVVNMSEAVESTYSTNLGKVELTQGRSPQVVLPEGVDLAQLGKAALRILGVAPDQAAALSAQVDWSTTLVFPFPANVESMRQVSINGAPGMAITETGNESGAMLYWQRGDRFYVMQIEHSGGGNDISEIIQMAESVR